MVNKKIVVLLPDGICLRNYVYTDFAAIAKSQNLDLIFLNNTSVDLRMYGLNSMPWPKIKLHKFTDSLKNALKINELTWFENKFDNPIYREYIFKNNKRGCKNYIKNSITKLFITSNPNEKSILEIREKIKSQERKTQYYKSWKLMLEDLQPDLVFSTSQRSAAAIASLEAAKELGIQTVCSVFSWDNLPKSTLLVEASHYFVWSDHMKEELATYYPFTKACNTYVTGTGQFENHYKQESVIEKAEFYNRFNLDLETTYICFSGDDITTSPYDPIYLEDVAQAVTQLNSNGLKLGIIFRRCPVDFSNRFDTIVDAYSDVITKIDPAWEMRGSSWDEKLPLLEDGKLQASIVHYTAFVMNIGSSMVFDYVIHDKPCVYFNYNPAEIVPLKKDVNVIYNYVHFKSMTSPDAVVWINNKKELKSKMEVLLSNPKATVHAAQEWFNKIVASPQRDASQRIVNSLIDILN
ncbi:UDP-glycosyltransferase [Nonlabens sp.]|jgi:hypothetical protein|uniref:UDP-glycosyltransferase n=1 Tax=Nonlabens sp. TaxID=1888209 RepID=UPI003F6A385B